MRDLTPKRGRRQAARPKTTQPGRPLWMPDEDLDRRATALETILLIAVVAVGILALCAIGGL